MRTFKQHLNEGQLSIDMKKMDKGDKKELIKLLQSLNVKRKFNLSLATVTLNRWMKLKAYYLDLDDLTDFLKDKGYKWAGGQKWAGRDMDITMENKDGIK